MLLKVSADNFSIEAVVETSIAHPKLNQFMTEIEHMILESTRKFDQIFELGFKTWASE
jgi:hypothetical protein